MYVFDSSALVKLYHSEVGTPLVENLANASGGIVRIFPLKPAQIVSAFAIEVRTKTIVRSDADLLLPQIRSDIATGSGFSG